MTSAKPWIGRKRVAFVPLFRSHAAPPDQIPADWENAIFRRVVYDPRREANGADRSLRAWLRAASSGLADIDPSVLPMQTIDKQVVEATELESALGPRLRDQRMDAAVLVMLGGRGAGTKHRHEGDALASDPGFRKAPGHSLRRRVDPKHISKDRGR